MYIRSFVTEILVGCVNTFLRIYKESSRGSKEKSLREVKEKVARNLSSLRPFYFYYTL